MFDEWKNGKKQEIMGSVLITSDGQVLVWGYKFKNIELNKCFAICRFRCMVMKNLRNV
jgi:hypothetical protein